MRQILQFVYTALLRLQGTVAAILTVIFLAFLPNAIADGAFITVPLILNLMSLTICVILLMPPATPTWLGRPSRKRHMFGMILGHAVITSLFMAVAMVSVLATGLSEPTSQNTAVSAALLLGFAGFFLSILGLLLSAWPPAHNLIDTTPYATDPTPTPHDPMELRALRRSRLG